MPRSSSQRQRGHTCAGFGYVFKSTWEWKLSQHFTNTGTLFFYEFQTFTLPNGQTYTPDFYLPETDEFIEVKPQAYRPYAIEKQRLLHESHPEITLRIVTEKDYPFFLKRMKEIPIVSPARKKKSRKTGFEHYSFWDSPKNKRKSAPKKKRTWSTPSKLRHLSKRKTA